MTAAARVTFAALFLSASLGGAMASDITDFGSWKKVQDPPHAGMDGVIDSVTQITLTADATSDLIPAGTDIGFQSIDGPDVASSTAGHYFSIDESFEVAVDFDLSAAGSQGLGAIGIGIGEDRAGADSAGVGLGFLNGAPFAFSGAARTSDATSIGLMGTAASASGRFFVSYDHLTGDISYGVSTTQGAASATETGTFAARQDEWNEADLLVSLFLRSDQQLVFQPLSDGVATAVFSNFEVLSGASETIPEPGAAMLLGAMLSLGAAIRRR